MPESPENRKSSRELKKHLLREISPIQMYTPAASYDHEERQSRHSWKAHTSSSSEEGSQDQESINKAYTIEKVYAKHSKFHLTSMTLYLLVGISPNDVLFEGVHIILIWKLSCIKSNQQIIMIPL